MHIAINSRSFLLPRYTGIGRYAFNLVRNLLDIDRDNQYTLYARKGLFDRKRRLPAIHAPNLTVREDHFGFGPAGVIPRFDVFHSPAPEMCPVKKHKLVVTIHDLVYKMFPEGHTPDACRQTDRQIRSLIPRARKFICCSESTRGDLMRFFEIPWEKTVVIHQGVDHDVFYSIGENEKQNALQRLKEMGIKTDYVLFVGTIEPRKNLERVLEAFAGLVKRGVFSGQLVIAGMMGWKTDGVHQAVVDLGINSHVLFLGYVRDFELRYLYNCCEAFVFPSMYEGFGYPILEALCCGAPVVTSDVSSCPEVAGDAAITVNPASSEEIAAAVEDILINEDLRADMVKKGFLRAEGFSFRKNAEQTLSVYREVGGGAR